MVDKITTIHKNDLGEKIGILNMYQLQQIDVAVKIWLDLN